MGVHVLDAIYQDVLFFKTKYKCFVCCTCIMLSLRVEAFFMDELKLMWFMQDYIGFRHMQLPLMFNLEWLFAFGISKINSCFSINIVESGCILFVFFVSKFFFSFLIIFHFNLCNKTNCSSCLIFLPYLITGQ